jgi:uncharacterized coiled-coil protein SlyX
LDLIITYLPNIVATVAVGVYSWWTQRNAAQVKEIEVLEAKIGDIDKRVSKLEFELSHLPSKDLVNDLKLTMSDLHGQLAAMAERLNAVGNTVSIIDRTLRDKN